MKIESLRVLNHPKPQTSHSQRKCIIERCTRTNTHNENRKFENRKFNRKGILFDSILWLLLKTGIDTTLAIRWNRQRPHDKPATAASTSYQSMKKLHQKANQSECSGNISFNIDDMTNIYLTSVQKYPNVRRKGGGGRDKRHLTSENDKMRA